MSKGDKVRFKWGKEERVGSFLRQDGAYYYFQVGNDPKNQVELYESEFTVLKGCGRNGCIIQKPIGQAPNGPCRCRI